jgi:hypothetical protein
MTKTNFDKLVRWDADYYNALTDDDCIVCLTEREIYLVGQIIDMLKWKNTRWIGNIVGLDFDLISDNLEYKLSERMTCQNITKLLDKIETLSDKVDYVFNQTAIDNGDTIPNEDTPAWDVTTPEEFAEDFSIATDGCDAPDKDAIYAGVYQLVRYVNQVNVDALQQLSQVGNLASQIDKLISAATGGLTPFDEVAGYVEFLVTELLDEYEATVDEALLDEVTCALFCIAVDSNCTINLSDVINYYGSKLGSTALDLTSSLLNVMQFAATGTFSGDEYFYFMTTFQFITVALTDHFFNVSSMQNYKTQILAGMNSPDNDWTLLCVECPPLYRLKTYNFEYGKLGWEINTSGVSSTHGVWAGNRWQGTLNQFNEKVIQVSLDTHETGWRLRGIKFYLTRENGLLDGSRDVSSAWLRPTINSSTGQIQIQNGNFLPNGDIEQCDKRTSSPFYSTGGTQIYVQQTVANNGGTGQVYLTKIDVLYELNYAPDESVITEDDDICV